MACPHKLGLLEMKTPGVVCARANMSTHSVRQRTAETAQNSVFAAAFLEPCIDIGWEYYWFRVRGDLR